MKQRIQRLFCGLTAAFLLLTAIPVPAMNAHAYTEQPVTKSNYPDLEADGTVYVNGIRLEEPYIEELSFGQCDLELPYQVPEEHYFLMGDQRESSVDSRLSQVGCIPGEQIVGRLVFCVWPLTSIRAVK